jgi:subtilase family serine protease
MIVSGFTAPTSAAAGSVITVSDTTKNQGPQGAGASTTRFYLSSDATWDASDLPLEGRSIPALAAGASNAGSTSVTVPAGTAPGVYHLIARADSDDAVPETRETNNTLSRSLTIQ